MTLIWIKTLTEIAVRLRCAHWDARDIRERFGLRASDSIRNSLRSALRENKINNSFTCLPHRCHNSEHWRTGSSPWGPTSACSNTYFHIEERESLSLHGNSCHYCWCTHLSAVFSSDLDLDGCLLVRGLHFLHNAHMIHNFQLAYHQPDQKIWTIYQNPVYCHTGTAPGSHTTGLGQRSSG